MWILHEDSKSREESSPSAAQMLMLTVGGCICDHVFDGINDRPDDACLTRSAIHSHSPVKKTAVEYSDVTSNSLLGKWNYWSDSHFISVNKYGDRFDNILMNPWRVLTNGEQKVWSRVHMLKNLSGLLRHNNKWRRLKICVPSGNHRLRSVLRQYQRET